MFKHVTRTNDIHVNQNCCLRFTHSIQQCNYAGIDWCSGVTKSECAAVTNRNQLLLNHSSILPTLCKNIY